MSDAGTFLAIGGLLAVGVIGVILLLRARPAVHQRDVGLIRKNMENGIAHGAREVSLPVRRDLVDDAVALAAEYDYELDSQRAMPAGISVVTLTFRRKGA